MSVSVVIHTCDESHYIEDCLKSVTWADEIVIIDMESADDTVEKCRKYTDRIFTHPRLPSADPARNFGLSKATCDWILTLDPDERASEPLVEKLKYLAEHGNADGYVLPFQTWMFGTVIRHSGWGGDKHLRFFRRGTVSFSAQVHVPPETQGRIETIEDQDCCVVHLNYSNFSQFIEKMNRYTSLEARRLCEVGRPFHWLKLFYQPSKEFINRYIRLKGYKDGLVGLMLALLMAFYTQLSYIKLWETYHAAARGEDVEADTVLTGDR